MAIQLLNPGEEIPPAEIIPAPVEETPPTKRGRGRPPGAKNKPKTVSEPAPVPPSEEEEEEEEDEEEEEEPAPPPKPKRRRPPLVVVAKAKATPKRQPRVAPPMRTRAETPSPPETPRSRRARVLGEYREYRVNQHAERRDRFTSMLNRFMH